ncbi:MAG: hypothetical protein R3F11_21735 [Verrucomicrobiales bacterium]
MTEAKPQPFAVRLPDGSHARARRLYRWLAALGLALWLAGVAGAQGDPPQTPEVAAAERIANRLVAEEKYAFRHASWRGALKPGKLVVLPVFLFSENDYAFALGFQGGAVPSLSIFDPNGKAIPTGVSAGAFRFKPPATGHYYIRLRIPANASGPVECCLNYGWR